MQARLIVNGDDLGGAESLNLGVMRAFDQGILTSSSLLAVGPCLEHAVEIARRRTRLGVGVHLTLDEYAPASSACDIPTLLGPDGQFPTRARALARILLGRARREEIRREWEAQIARVVDAGLRPTHLDGHGHCHACPGVAGLVVELAQRFGIPAVRLPAEPARHLGRTAGFPARRYLEKLVLRAACAPAALRWRGRLRVPDAFYGFMEGGHLDLPSLEAIAGRLRPGVSELMAHPGVSRDDRPFSVAYDRPVDLETLTRYTRGEFEDRFRLRLVSYREAWPDHA